MANVASYKQETILETDHKINLIYGLNGSGKSTFSNYLYDRENIEFSDCSIEPQLDDNTKLLVYNQNFIYDNFYQSEAQPGIFSLSKENKEAQKRIASYNKELDELKNQRLKQEENNVTLGNKFDEIKNNAINKIWEIKVNFTGGDRVLDFCLDKLNHPKTKPFEYLLNIVKTEQKPEKTIEQLKQEAVLLKGTADSLNISIPVFEFPEAAYENDPIFEKIIVGNNDSSVANLIKQLNNQNWVKDGLQYLSVQNEDEILCPFCQSQTITEEFIQRIKDFFSGEYEHDIKYLEDIGRKYGQAIQRVYNIPTSFFETISFLNDLESEFQDAKKFFYDIIDKNLDLMRDKYRTPNISIKLASSIEALNKINDVLKIARQRIDDFNQKIAQRQKSLEALKTTFWQIQRWEYDQTISAYIANKQVFDKEAEEIAKNFKKIDNRSDELKQLISTEQEKTVNIKDAIDNINNNLLSIGIDSFRIETYQDNLYKITRHGQDSTVFLTLSEGEKMMISFLYFLELCRGKQSSTEVVSKKIIVIDDPISSLSHIYVFNVGRLIEQEFLKTNNKYEQIFILTHSLYFFYELHKLAPHPKYKQAQTPEVQEHNDTECKNKVPKLFRLGKNSITSYITELQDTEIQNDYQAYWSIIKDKNSPNILIANAMRNIIEYFFGFIEKSDYNNVFQRRVLCENKFQAFNRFMQAGSHSRPHLIYDFKEFDYDVFREAFRLVFRENNYEEHYKKMMGEK